MESFKELWDSHELLSTRLAETEAMLEHVSVVLNKILDETEKERDEAIRLLGYMLYGAEASDTSWHNWLEQAKILVGRHNGVI